MCCLTFDLKYIVETPKLRKTDHIDLYTGLRRSQDKKMEALKEKCGRVLQDILATGEITAKKASVSNSTRTAINTKECGPWIRNTVREPTGEMTLESYVVNTQATGSKTRSTAVEPSSSRIVTDMMDIGSMACHRERVE